MARRLKKSEFYWTYEEVIEVPVVKAIMSKFRADQQDKIARYFYNVHSRHYNAWESAERKQQHSLNNIRKITWNGEEQCFHVFYKKTKDFSPTWYHYTLSGDWY